MKKFALAFAITSLFAISAQASTIDGTASATFSNPTPGTVFQGVGTNSFTWGNPGNFGVGANNLHFTSSAFSAQSTTPFTLGTSPYSNGTTASGSNASSVELNTHLDFSQAAIPTFNANFALALNSTPNTGNNRQNADFVSFNNMTASNTFKINGITYHFEITGFQNVIGDGFLDSSADQFHVMEGRRAQADLYGNVTASVPEPETYAMLLAGLAGLGLFSRRRKAA